MTEVSEGDTLTLANELTAPYIGYPGYGPNSMTIESGQEVRVKKVGRATVWLRGVTSVDGKRRSLVVNKDELDQYVGADAPKKRKLGEVPEGGLPADDPRIQWIFEDAAKVATRAGYCSVYDDITSKVGIPGRPRDFVLTKKVAGFSVRKKINARSEKEADLIFEAELAAAGLTADATPETVTA